MTSSFPRPKKADKEYVRSLLDGRICDSDMGYRTFLACSAGSGQHKFVSEFAVKASDQAFDKWLTIERNELANSRRTRSAFLLRDGIEIAFAKAGNAERWLKWRRAYAETFPFVAYASDSP